MYRPSHEYKVKGLIASVTRAQWQACNESRVSTRLVLKGSLENKWTRLLRCQERQVVSKSILHCYGDEICSYCLCLSAKFWEVGVMLFSSID